LLVQPPRVIDPACSACSGRERRRTNSSRRSPGANIRASGRFEQSEGGTLFLDEIGDMPMEAQTRLLRVLQQGECTTVGGRTPIKSDVRIVAASNKDLRIHRWPG
jgi:DNA-binding NtrC family response regulator